MSTHSTVRTPRRIASALLAVTLAAGIGSAVRSAAVPAPIAISQLPLTIQIPAHPQILLAVGNSQSMDGDLSGAIYTGSGALAANLAGLNASSSPVNFTVPAGFTTPVTNDIAGASSPYTVISGGLQLDNSASRLNVSKAGITSILQTFLSVADFGLIDYQTANRNEYTTWVYYMSPNGGFQFSNTIPGTGEYVTNPCYNIPLDNANPIDSDCNQLNGRYPNINTYQYMLLSASSDDAAINDVLYAGGESPVCVVYGGPHPPTPFPPNFSLGQYEGGGVLVGYNNALPNPCATVTGPTNAGYVPYSTEVMYAERGYGFYTFSETAKPASLTSWPPLVTMTTAGQTPTAGTVATALARFTSFLAPETNSTGTGEIKAEATQSPIAGLLRAAHDYYRSANPASSNGCAATRYVVLVTDGLPTMDFNGNSWPPLGSAAAAGYGVSATFNSDGSLTTSNTNDQALIDTMTALTALNAAGIETYIIGVGAGVDPSNNPVAAATLTAMAIAGGTGNYFAATSPGQLNTDMQVILAKILAATQSTASTAVNSTGLHVGATAYLAQFTTSDTNQDWTGDLSAYPINVTTGAVSTAPSARLWSAQAQLDTQNWFSGRMIATWDPVAMTGTPFRWGTVTPPNGISATTTLGLALQSFAPDTNGQDVLQFLRGDNAKELRNGGQFRNRTHKLGDIVDSAPLYVGPPNSFWQSNSYVTFVQNHKNRAPIVYVGANDGMLHAFDAATGSERFAYVPNGVWGNLINLVNPYYNEQHHFYVNGSPQAADIQFVDNTWHTVLMGTEGAGGSTVFALDISDADSFADEAALSSAVLWEFSDPDMGMSFSEPSAANTNAGWVVFFGNGYNSAQQKPFLYALDPQTGAIKSKIDLCAAVAGVCNTGVANGLSSVAVANSTGVATAAADTVYAGDLQGNMWRVNVSNGTPSNWVVSVVFQARDAGGNPQPITTLPTVSLNPDYPRILGTMVFFGTGQLLGLADLSTTQTESVYGIFDPPPASSPPVGFAGIPTRANLVQQSMTTASISGVSVRVESTVNPVNIPTNRGWYLDFNLASGERIVTNPQVEAGGGIVVTSYQPNASSCTGGGNAWLSVFNYASGGSFPLPELDINGDGQLGTGDQTASGLNPVGMSLGSVYASQATIMSMGSGNGVPGANKMMSLSNSTITNVNERGPPKQRTGWWEVRH
jgi:type IV pilus assembly protein PilY1